MIIAVHERAQRWWIALAGLGGGLLIAVAQSSHGGGFTPQVGVQGTDAYFGSELYTPLVVIAVTVLALGLVRWWPYLVAVGGLLCVSIAWPSLAPGLGDTWMEFYYTYSVAFPLVVIGALGAAQRLLCTGSPGLGATVAGLVIGLGLFARALPDNVYRTAGDPALPVWRMALVVAGLAAVAPVIGWWRGDPAATGLAGEKPWSWNRLRPVIAGGLVALLALQFQMFGTERLAELLGVAWRTLTIYPNAKSAIVGGTTLAAAVIVTLLAGRWPLAGALTVATAQIATTAPLAVALIATSDASPARWIAALGGVALGAAAAATRWRAAAAATLMAAAAICVLIAFSATSGEPQKLAGRFGFVPALVMIVLTIAAATAAAGATASVLVSRGAVPAVLGPITSVLVAAGADTVVVLDRGSEERRRLIGEILPLDTAGTLMLLAAAAIGGVGIAHYLSERWAERKQAELIRQEAAAAERDRLARPIHDGVLQVLAMVQREGSELGGTGAQLAALAGEQEVALRNLLSGTAAKPGAARVADLRDQLNGLASPSVEFSGPLDPVPVPAASAVEIFAAVQAALDNVRQHAGPGARAWILLEEEDDGSA